MEAMIQPEGRPARGKTEDQFTKTMEKYTAAVPSSAYLAVAIGAMGLSLLFQATAAESGETLLLNGFPPGSSWVYTTNW